MNQDDFINTLQDWADEVVELEKRIAVLNERKRKYIEEHFLELQNLKVKLK